MRVKRARSRFVIVTLTLLTCVGLVTPAAAAVSGTSRGSFYSYDGATPLADLSPGTVLQTRTVSYHLEGIPLPIQVVQLLYRSQGALGQPTTNVTSVLKPPLRLGAPRAVSYQSAYDSLNPADEPSVHIAGGTGLGGVVNDAEALLIVPLLLAGDTVIIPDTEGQHADFAAGPEYGRNTLDSLRAATHSTATALGESTAIGMLGYSGGAIATNWAAQLAPTYAPELNERLVGAAEGGVLVDPAHNLNYVSGSLVWSDVIPMAVIGISRAYHIDLTPYLNAYGRKLYHQLQDVSITSLGQHPGLRWQQLVKPRYDNPDSIPIFVKTVNKLNMGQAPAPTIPMFIGQGANGTLEGTPSGGPGVGPGDGVMIAGDVRSLAGQFCAEGTTVDYTQYDALSHVSTVPVWAPAAIAWLEARFTGLPAPDNCDSIAPGNSLAPEQVTSQQQ